MKKLTLIATALFLALSTNAQLKVSPSGQVSVGDYSSSSGIGLFYPGGYNITTVDTVAALRIGRDANSSDSRTIAFGYGTDVYIKELISTRTSVNRYNSLLLGGKGGFQYECGDSKIPYRMPLLLNNVSVSADGYYYVSNVETSSATRSSSIGFSKARVTFDATGPIEINQNVTVDNGSDVTFISPELVKLKNLTVKNNSKVTIVCGNGYTVDGTCDCELGSELIIKQKV